MKVLNKEDVLKTNQVQATKTERRVLEVGNYGSATTVAFVQQQSRLCNNSRVCPFRLLSRNVDATTLRASNSDFDHLFVDLQVINHPFIVKLHYAFQVCFFSAHYTQVEHV
jgi:hypothetical protein